MMNGTRKVLACVCGRLKSAFQIASRSGSMADVQYVAHQYIKLRGSNYINCSFHHIATFTLLIKSEGLVKLPDQNYASMDVYLVLALMQLRELFMGLRYFILLCFPLFLNHIPFSLFPKYALDLCTEHAEDLNCYSR